MRRFCFALAVLSTLLVSCGEKNREEDKPAFMQLTLRTDLPEGATADIYTKDGPDVRTVIFEGGQASVTLPAETRRIYAVAPTAAVSEGNASRVTVRVAAQQRQASSGQENLLSRALYAIADPKGGEAPLHFDPLCGTVCVKVSGSPAPITGAGIVSTREGLCGEAGVNLIKSERYPGGSGKKVSVALDNAAPAGQEARLWIRTAAANLGKVKVCAISSDKQYEFSLSKDLDCSGAATVVVELDLQSDCVLIDGVEDTGATSGLSEHDFNGLEPMDDDYEDTDRIPDFSRVGYKYGDEAIPSPSVAATIDLAAVSAALSAHSAKDTTDYIQKVIDQVGAAGGGTVLLKNGTYNVSRILFLDRSGVVLRGESESGTVIKFRRHIQMPVINIGATVTAATAPDGAHLISGRVVNVSTMKAAGTGGSSTFGSVTLYIYTPRISDPVYGFISPVVDDYTPLGRLYLRVRDASKFHPGEKVAIFRPGTAKWISDIGMDKIADNGRSAQGSGTIQWDPTGYTFYWSRVVTAVKGDQVWLDAPVVMALDRQYGSGMLVKYQMERVTGCGVEKLTVDCDYDASQIYSGQPVDERHAWSAVSVTAAEHCWIRNLTSRHMGFALAKLDKGSRCISVLDCSCLEPVSAVQGARRYAFCASDRSELGLFKNCRCDYDRHSFVNNGASLGPHVFTQCTATNAQSSIGPHNNFATGTLFDCITSDGNMEVQDAGNMGTGHGWRGANTVFWNCDNGTHSLVVQSLWASAKNYSVGNICRKLASTSPYEKDYYGNPVTDYYVQKYGYGPDGENRPDGEWYPERKFKTNGGTHVSLPHQPGLSWWPINTLESYSNPLSLYECQLQERHANGIYLNLL